MASVIAAYNFCNPDFKAFLDGAADAGFQHVAIGFYKNYLDVPLEGLSAADEASVKKQLADRGLTMVAIFGGSNLLDRSGLELLKKKLDGAARFGVKALDTGSFSMTGKTPEKIEADTATFVDQIRRAGDHADKHGITLCLETHGGYTGTSDACLKAMADVKHPRVRIAYDPANFLYYEGARPEHRLAELIPFIGHTHLKDHRGGKGNNDFPAIGEGEVGYRSLLPSLEKGGYSGAYTLERAFGQTNEEKAVSLKKAYALMKELVGGK